MSGRIHVDDLRFLGDQFKRAREALGFERVELVREAGYRNINKGCRKILHIERGKPPLSDERVLERFAHALDLDLDEMWEQIDRREEARRREERERHKLWLGRLLSQAREQKGWSVEQVVEAAGLSPVARHARRLERIESGERRFPTLDEIEALTEALEVAGLEAFQAFKRECEYYDRLDGQARIVARLMPAFYNRVRYPAHFTTEEVLDFATEFSSDKGFKVCVTLGDGRVVYIEPDGERFESWQGPTMTIG